MYGHGRMYDSFIKGILSPASKPKTVAPELKLFSDLPRFANTGIGGLMSTMLSGAGVGAVTGGIASDGEMGGILKGAAAGAFGGAVARRMYQPTLMAANRGARGAIGAGEKVLHSNFDEGGFVHNTAMKLGQKGQKFSDMMDGSVSGFHSAGVRRAAYMSRAGLAGAAAGYRNNKRGQGQGYQSKNLSSGRLNSGRGNMLHR